MLDIQNLSVAQLRKAVGIKEQIERLQHQLNSMAGGGPPVGEIPSPFSIPRGKKRRRKLSAAARANIAAAARARWARMRGEAVAEDQPPKKKKPLSAAKKAALKKALAARWAKYRAAKQAA